MTRGPSRTARKAQRKPAARRRKSAKAVKASKAMTRDPMDDFIAAAARMLELKINPAWLPAVRGHLAVTLQHGARVMDFTLPDDAEPAPVFRP